jgi:MFS transporter, DHA1 family, chloramphenicol/florfenicol resistance protein
LLRRALDRPECSGATAILSTFRQGGAVVRTQNHNQSSWSFSLTAALVLLCPFDLIASLGMDMYLPAIPDMPGALGTTPQRIQLTLSGYLVLLGAGQLIFGPLSDRYGRRPVLLTGAVVYTLSSLGLAWTRSLWPFVFLRIVESASGAAMLVATFATVRDVYATRKEGTTIYSIMSAILVFVPAVGPLLGAGLYEAGGLRAVFLTLAALPAIAGIRAFYLWPETRPAESRGVRFRQVGAVLSHPDFWTYMLGYGVAMGSFFVYFSIAPGLLIHHYGYSPLGFGLMFGTVALVLIGVSRFAGRLVERYGLAGCLFRGMGLIMMGAVLLVVRETTIDSVVSFMLPAWIIAVGIAITVAVAANGALAPFSEIAGTSTALYYCLSSVFLVSTGTAAVVLLPGGTAWPLVAYGGLGAVLVMMLLARSRQRTA